jgi:hypothetical protein
MGFVANLSAACSICNLLNFLPSSRVMAIFFFFFFLAVSLLSCVEVEARNDGPIDQPEAFADVVKKYYPLRSFRLLAAADSGISLSLLSLHPQMKK